ncbi:MAG: sterol-binding protein [Arhodomonas sp.]|nr:sterol-binding protein [Arhodomonas sp.]
MDPDSPRRLEPLVGRTLAVRVTDPELAARAEFVADGLRLSPPGDAETADAELDASVPGLLALASSGGRRSRDVAFRGDVGVIQEVRALFAGLDVDWEEHLSRLTGDIIAHQVGRGVRDARAWGERTADSLITTLGEYLTEEARYLPPAAEAAAFIHDVDRLRADCDRLEARIRRLERRLDGAEGSHP